MSSETFECPSCGEDVEVEILCDGVCPECGNEYWWTEEASYDDEGYEEERWETIEWDRYEPLEEDEEDYEYTDTDDE